MLDVATATANVARFELIRHSKTGLFIAQCAEYPTVFAHGRTEEEAEANSQTALKDYLEVKYDCQFSVAMIGEAVRSFDKVRFELSAESLAAA